MAVDGFPIWLHSPLAFREIAQRSIRSAKCIENRPNWRVSRGGRYLARQESNFMQGFFALVSSPVACLHVAVEEFHPIEFSELFGIRDPKDALSVMSP
jgi:hypothetical protein